MVCGSIIPVKPGVRNVDSLYCGHKQFSVYSLLCIMYNVHTAGARRGLNPVVFMETVKYKIASSNSFFLMEDIT